MTDATRLLINVSASTARAPEGFARHRQKRGGELASGSGRLNVVLDWFEQAATAQRVPMDFQPTAFLIGQAESALQRVS